MKLTIIGSASAEPNPGSASSCYLLDAGEGNLVLELGHGASAKLLQHAGMDQVGAVLISHMHPDHFFDLVPLKYFILFNQCPRLRLILPPTGPRVLAAMAEALGENGRFWSKSYDIDVFDPNGELNLMGMKITMTKTHHFIPAWSMRVTETISGAVLGYTSDTSLSEPVVAHLSRAELLLAEASMERQTLPGPDQGHLTGNEAGELACRALAKRLILTHYPCARGEALLAAARSAFQGQCDLATEGQTYTIEK